MKKFLFSLLTLLLGCSLAWATDVTVRIHGTITAPADLPADLKIWVGTYSASQLAEIPLPAASYDITITTIGGSSVYFNLGNSSWALYPDANDYRSQDYFFETSDGQKNRFNIILADPDNPWDPDKDKTDYTVDLKIVPKGGGAVSVNLFGSVVSAPNQGISNATVSITDGNSFFKTTSTTQMEWDEAAGKMIHGYYRFKDVPSGSYTLTYTKDGYAAANQSFTVNAETPATAELPTVTMQAAAAEYTFAGNLTYVDVWTSEGAYVSGATVSAYADYELTQKLGETTTDAQGHWTLTVECEANAYIYFSVNSSKVTAKTIGSAQAYSTSSEIMVTNITCEEIQPPAPSNPVSAYSLTQMGTKSHPCVKVNWTWSQDLQDNYRQSATEGVYSIRYYTLQRKIGTDGWTDIATYYPDDYYTLPTPSYVDTGSTTDNANANALSLDNGDKVVSYRIYQIQYKYPDELQNLTYASSPLTLTKANAEPDNVEVKLSVDGNVGGTVSGGGIYLEGDNVVITATPAEGYMFVEWKMKEGGAQVATTPTHTITNIQTNLDLVAVFAQEVTLTIDYNATMGTVEGAGTYAKGTGVTAKAIPAQYHLFVEWQENGAKVSDQAEYTFTIEANRTLTAIFKPDSATLTLERNNTAMGTVEGAAKYPKGTNVTAKAIPAQYHLFVEWRENGAKVSDQAEYTFLFTGNRTLTAVFKRDSATLTLQTNNTDIAVRGEVSGGGKYPKGTNVTAKATTKPYHQFVGWKNAAGTQISTEKTFTFFFTQDSTLTAVFECDSVNLTLQPNNAAMGSVSGAGKYHAGNNATATATPAENHSFVEWQENGSRVSAANPYTFAITAARSLTAVFKPDTVTLTLKVNDETKGTVSGGRRYQKGTQATATATPTGYNVFVGWRNADNVVESTANPYTFTMTGNRTLTALFQPDSVNLALSVNEDRMGTVKGAGKKQKGEHVDIDAEAKDGYIFVEWKNGDEHFADEAEYQFEILEDMSLKAFFKPDSVQLNLSVKDAYMGTVTGGGLYRRGRSATIQAIPNDGYRWKEWRENDTVVTRAKTNPHTFNIQRDRNLVAVFEPDSVYVTLEVNNADWGSVTGNGRYRRQQTARLKATPATNYVFEKWMEADTIVKMTNGAVATAEFTTRQLTANRTLKAYFKRDSAVLTVKPNVASYGTVTGGGKYAKGQQVTVTATANGDNEFLGWRKNDGSTVNTNPTYTFEFTGTLTLTAWFKVPDPDSSTLTLTANNDAWGTASARNQVGGAKFEAGETVEITATPNEGYKFVEWQEDGSQLSTENPCEIHIEANADRTIQAVFAVKPDSVYLTLKVNDAKMGTVEAESEIGDEVKIKYEKNQKVSVIAHPTDDDLDYVFVAWKDEAGAVVSDKNPYEFNIASDLTLTAWFQPDSVDLKLDVNETRMGTVKGAGRYPKGAHVAISAEENDGYAFVEWQKDGVRYDNGSDNESTMTVDLDEPLHLTAFFKPDSVQLKLSVKDPKAGSVKGAGTFRRNTEVTIEAIAVKGYKFASWNENDTVVKRAVNAKHTFTILKDRDLVAVFAPDSVELTLEANNTDWGTVTGGGKFARTEEITIKAIPNEGYVFESWRIENEEGDVFSDEATHTYTITTTRKLMAVFAKAPEVVKETYTLYLHVDEEQGTVEGAGQYEENTIADIKAVAKAGYKFKAWTTGETDEIVATTAEHKVLMTRDSTLTAVFEVNEIPVEQVTLTLSASPAEGGTVTQSGDGTYDKGTGVTATATPNEGYKFVAWQEDGADIDAAEAVYTFTIEDNRTLTAVFEQLPPVVEQVTLTLSASPAEGGTVTQSGDGTYGKGASVTATATPNEGYKFVAWQEGETEVHAEAVYTFEINANRELTAVFAKNETPVVEKVTLTLNANNADWGRVDGAGEFDKGTSVTAKAIANEGYEFKEWQENGTQVSDKAEYTFTMEANRTLTAVFAAKEIPVVNEEVTLTLNVNDTKMGTVTGAGKFKKGTEVTVKATANKGYVFRAWKNGAETVSTEAEHTFVLNEDVTLMAVFAPGDANEALEQAVWSVYAEARTIVLCNETPCRYEVYTVSGRKVAQGGANGQQVRVEVSHSGLYVVRCITASGITTKKVAVR